MTNRHNGRVADAFKHLSLAALLAETRPQRYVETHAGHATYPSTRTPEREYGVFTFRELAEHDMALASSCYRTDLESIMRATGRAPGSPAVAMAELGRHGTYVFCDVDGDGHLGTATTRGTGTGGRLRQRDRASSAALRTTRTRSRHGLSRRAIAIRRDGSTRLRLDRLTSLQRFETARVRAVLRS